MSVNKDTRTGPSFGLSTRLLRILWIFCWLLLCRWTPPPLHRWRALVLRAFGAKLGKQTHIYASAQIWAPWNLTVDDQVGIGPKTMIYSQGKISIGARAVISQGSHLCAGTHDYNDPGFRLITKPIVIGADCWIAAEAFIHPGVTLGEGCVVGARSVVTSDLPEWSICSGFPAKVLRERNQQLSNIL